MAKSLLLCALSAACLLGAASELAADSYRCGRKLVRTGDSSAAVLSVCGEPRLRDKGLESIVLAGTRQQLTVERWYYRQSRRSLEHVVMFYRGRVVAIAVGGR